MNASEVLALALQQGVHVGVDPARHELVLTPARRANAQLKALLRTYKEELLVQLTRQGDVSPPDVASRGPPAQGVPPRAILAPPNTTPTPDVFFDELAPALSDGELRVMLYLIRRTYGFKRSADQISLTQFTDGITTREGKRLDHGTGMTRRGVVLALTSLEKRSLVLCERRKTKQHGHQANVYRLHLGEEGNGGAGGPEGA